MRINPLSFSSINVEPMVNAGVKDFTPVTMRYNSLQDIEFDIISDKIKSQNLKNNMDVRLTQLKKTLNKCLAKDLYMS
ncbi:hypothetical protein IKQ26_09450 [bacterium]|nr:hypothetical protein [bacterium]